jgi:tRNA threonylcarbamoyladenosine modification (KEOPS) complex  Pcc1 subunit
MILHKYQWRESPARKSNLTVFLWNNCVILEINPFDLSQSNCSFCFELAHFKFVFRNI